MSADRATRTKRMVWLLVTALAPVALSSLSSSSLGSRPSPANGTPQAQLTSDLLFTGRVHFVGFAPSDLTIGDFNADGVPDVAVASTGRRVSFNEQVPGEVSVLVGRGDGSFLNPFKPQASGNQAGIAAADFNEDGRDDLVVVNSPSRAVQVLLAAGEGFAPAAPIHPGDVSAEEGGRVVVADFNGDGHADVASAEGGGYFAVLVGRGDGTFSPATRHSAGGRIRSMVVVDLNGDGIQDLATAVTPDSQTSVVSVVRGHGDGTFEAPLSVPTPPAPFGIVAGDFTGDARVDIVFSVIVRGGDSVWLLENLGEDSFAPARSIFSDTDTSIVQATQHAADIDGDGDLDLISLNGVLENDGNGMFEARLFPHRLPVFNVRTRTHDLNRDGAVDLVLVLDPGASPGVFMIELGQPSGNLLATRKIPEASGTRLLCTGDFDENMAIDLVVSLNDGRPAVIPGKGGGLFGDISPIASPGYPVSGCATGDINADGHTDAIIVGEISNRVSTYLGDGTGRLTHSESMRSANHPVTALVGDFTGDGTADLAVLNYAAEIGDFKPGRISIFPGTGSSFTPPANYLTTLEPRSMVAADFNGDGVQDLAAAGRVGFTILVSQAGGGHSVSTVFLGYSFSRTVAVGDFNEDGYVDLALSDRLYFGNGDGSFRPGGSLAIGEGVVADVNNDGHLDLVWSRFEPYLRVALGNGQGGFAPPVVLWSPLLEPHLAADFDGDGRTDLLAGWNEFFSMNEVALFRNIGPLGDLDGDGTNDVLDVCVDTDGDGHGDPVFSGNTCPPDNCPREFNPSQIDTDGDGLGDACDPCLTEAGEDSDRDAVCGASDNCPGTPNPDQGDSDGDGFGDACDNCPRVANPEQEDSNEDGSGDACQPTLSIEGILEDGGVTLEVLATATDPQGDPLSGWIRLWGHTQPVALPNALLATTLEEVCRFGLTLDYGSIGYRHFPENPNYASLFDMDDFDLRCGDEQRDLHFAAGACGMPGTRFWPNPGDFDLTRRPLPAAVCVGRFLEVDGFQDLTILDFDSERLLLGLGPEEVVWTTEFQGHLPLVAGLSDVTRSAHYRLEIIVTDGDTRPVTVSRNFQYNGESVLTTPCPGSTGDADGDHFPNECDNCPADHNADQYDSDGDGQGDACDPCTDSDGDGFADTDFPSDICPPDNCSYDANPLQEDTDGDGFGDACDLCLDTTTGNDEDEDGCADQDNCPMAHNPDQHDEDGDGVGDPCDNCYTTHNPDQADSNGDGGGDACQPVLHLDGIVEDGGVTLEVRAWARDPEDDPLYGGLLVHQATEIVLVAPESGSSDCSAGYSPDGVPGQGIGLLAEPSGTAVLYDVDSRLGCVNSAADYIMALGNCNAPLTGFGTVLPLDTLVLPGSICVLRLNEPWGVFELDVVEMTSTMLRAFLHTYDAVWVHYFADGLPRRTSLSGLVPGGRYILHIDASDNLTPPVRAELPFLYQGETELLINNPPRAAAAGPAAVECASPEGTLVRLDGSGSTDVDVRPGGSEVLSYEWLLNPGQSDEVVIGRGVVVTPICRPVRPLSGCGSPTAKANPTRPRSW